MTFKPILNNILIKLEPRPKEFITDGGIILPDRSRAGAPMKGVVVAVGNGKITSKGKLIPPTFTPGDTVVFSEYTGTELTLDNTPHIIIPENQLVGTLE
tara:strand:- start:11 stop:307 length:297 start_codon:yes stop_codon:yes gene_type:complete